MPTYTPEELRTLHPKQFEKEYNAWREYEPHHDWADWIKENFEAEMKCVGIHVDNFYWDIGYSQSDGASFDGHVVIHEWMEADSQYAEQYPALYLACKQDGSYVSARTGSRGQYVHFNLNESWFGTDPCGIFHMLDKDTWVQLVEDQSGFLDVETEIKSTCERFMSEMYYKLRDEYEDTTSEEAFIESCNCNDVTFEIEGEECEV
jgi:hypothetical protein